MPFAQPVSPAQRIRRQRAIARSAHAALHDPGTGSPVPLVSNVLRTYDTATAEDRSAGLDWYAQAHAFAGTLTAPTVRHAAGIVAALSPQLSWSDNVAAARDITQGGTGSPAGLGLSLSRAALILQGKAPEHVLGGRKVRSFYRNILQPDRPGPVTVDRHAISVAFGYVVSDAEAKCLERLGVYAQIAGAYRTAARTAGILPHQLQAITWLAHRNALDAAGRHGVRSNLEEVF